MGKLLCEKNLRDVWCRNESVRAEIGAILHTHTHARTHARSAKLVVVEMRAIMISALITFSIQKQRLLLQSWAPSRNMVLCSSQ